MDICDRLDPLAERIGAVNTVLVEPDGSLLGSNSDAFGFIENLRQGMPAWHASAGPAVILGAGGAARALIVGLLEAGAPEIRLLNRSFHGRKVSRRSSSRKSRLWNGSNGTRPWAGRRCWSTRPALA